MITAKSLAQKEEKAGRVLPVAAPLDTPQQAACPQLGPPTAAAWRHSLGKGGPDLTARPSSPACKIQSLSPSLSAWHAPSMDVLPPLAAQALVYSRSLCLRPCHCAPGHMNWAEAEVLEPQSLSWGLPSTPSSTLVAWHTWASAMTVCPDVA